MGCVLQDTEKRHPGQAEMLSRRGHGGPQVVLPGLRRFDDRPDPGPVLRRLVLVTDAWRPQTNGVVNTLVRLVKYMEATGLEVLVTAPDGHRTAPLPAVPESRLPCDP